MLPENIRISIVSHGLRAGGGISVGKNFIANVIRVMPEAEFQVFVPEGLSYENCVDESARVEWHGYRSRLGKAGRWFYDRFFMPRKIEKFKPSLIICLGNVGAKTNIAPQMLLIQDAHYFYPSKYYSREPWLQKLAFSYMRYHFSQDLKRTQVLLCQTNTAIERIQAWYKFKGKAALLPNAISSVTSAGSVIEGNIPRRFQQNKFCVFYLARYYTHKNIEILIDLFVRYRQELEDTVLHLTIAEDQHPNVKKILDAIQINKLDANIINIGPVKQEEIARIYSEMDALVMPSTLESFSGTYLEAMEFGCPVVTSDLDFAREVCGDAALYFDPWNVDELFIALTRIKNEPELADRLREKGKKISDVGRNSWECNARIIRSIAVEMVA